MANKMKNNKAYIPKVISHFNLTPRYGFVRNNAGLPNHSIFLWRLL